MTVPGSLHHSRRNKGSQYLIVKSVEATCEWDTMLSYELRIRVVIEMLSAALLALALLLLRKRRRFTLNASPLLRRRCETREKKSLKLLLERLAEGRRKKVEREKRDRRWWVRPLLQYHDQYGAWVTSIKVMIEEDHEKFYSAFRMTVETFDWLLKLLQPFLIKDSWRKPVSPGERLAITLRYLASGDSFASLENYFLVAEETIGSIVFETTTAIYHALTPVVFEPLSQETWLRVATGFEAMWDVPHCVGAIDGKHVRIHPGGLAHIIGRMPICVCRESSSLSLSRMAPPRSGSMYFNYKHYFSSILLAVCDAKMKLLYVDFGSCGRRGDGNVYHRSRFAKKLRNDKLNLPPPCSHEGIGDAVPFYFLGDAAFERGSHMVTPCKGTFLPAEKKVFNYRVSRGRRVIENVFGLLYKRYEIFQKPIQTSFECAKSIVKAACALHNLHLMDEHSSEPCRRKNRPGKYFDQVKDDGTLVYGRYRNEDPLKEEQILQRLMIQVEDADENEASLGGGELSESLIDYFINYDLPWQWKSAGIV